MTLKILDDTNKGAVIHQQSHTYSTPAQAKKEGRIATFLTLSAHVVGQEPKPEEITIAIIGKGAEEAKNYKLHTRISDPITSFDQGNPKVSFSLEEMKRSFFGGWRGKKREK